MAVPSLPGALDTDDVVDNSWVDAVRDNLEWHLDTFPLFKGHATADPQNFPGSDTDVATSTNTLFGFGSGGAFTYTPDINVGSWVPNSADADPEPLLFPETGIYRATIAAEWEANATGYRITTARLNGSDINGGRATLAAATGSLATRYTHSVVFDVTSTSDEFSVNAYQTSGSTLDLEIIYVTLEWMQST